MFEHNAKTDLSNVLSLLTRINEDDLKAFGRIVGLPGFDHKNEHGLRADLTEAFSSGMLYLDFTTSYRLRLLALNFQMMTDDVERDRIAGREYDPIKEFCSEWYPAAVLETFTVRDEKRATEAGWGIKYDCPVWSPWIDMNDDYDRVEGLTIGCNEIIYLPKPGRRTTPSEKISIADADMGAVRDYLLTQESLLDSQGFVFDKNWTAQEQLNIARQLGYEQAVPASEAATKSVNTRKMTP